MSEIMASLDDINAFLDGTVVYATDENTDLIQIAVSRIVRGYLARVYDITILYGWDTPDTTPEVIRSIAGMLIASQLYIDKLSGQEFRVDVENYAQILYDRAIALLNGIIDGSIIVTDGEGVIIEPSSPESLTTLDFWPIDDTDRAFTMSMRLDG